MGSEWALGPFSGNTETDTWGGADQPHTQEIGELTEVGQCAGVDSPAEVLPRQAEPGFGQGVLSKAALSWDVSFLLWPRGARGALAHLPGKLAVRSCGRQGLYEKPELMPGS